MQQHFHTPPSDGSCVQIEVEPLSILTISLTDGPALCELQRYTREHGVHWLNEREGLYDLLMPYGTLQQRIGASYNEREELYVIHLPGRGALEHRRVLHPSSAPSDPQAWPVSTISLFCPL